MALNDIAIIIPTLDRYVGVRTGRMALEKAGGLLLSEGVGMNVNTPGLQFYADKLDSARRYLVVQSFLLALLRIES